MALRWYLFIFLWLMGGTSKASYTFQPEVEIKQLYSSNINLSSKASSSLVTTIKPSIEFNKQQRDKHIHFRYQLETISQQRPVKSRLNHDLSSMYQSTNEPYESNMAVILIRQELVEPLRKLSFDNIHSEGRSSVLRSLIAREGRASLLQGLYLDWMASGAIAHFFDKAIEDTANLELKLNALSKSEQLYLEWMHKQSHQGNTGLKQNSLRSSYQYHYRYNTQFVVGIGYDSNTDNVLSMFDTGPMWWIGIKHKNGRRLNLNANIGRKAYGWFTSSDLILKGRLYSIKASRTDETSTTSLRQFSQIYQEYRYQERGTANTFYPIFEMGPVRSINTEIQLIKQHRKLNLNVSSYHDQLIAVESSLSNRSRGLHLILNQSFSRRSELEFMIHASNHQLLAKRIDNRYMMNLKGSRQLTPQLKISLLYQRLINQSTDNDFNFQENILLFSIKAN